MTTGEVLLQYQQRIGELQDALGVIQTRQSATLAIALLAALIALGAGFFAYSRRLIPTWYPAAALPPLVIALRHHNRLRRQAQNTSSLHTHYSRARDRMEGNGEGPQGGEFQPTNHPFASDLCLFGPGSLFQRLCTARTHIGQQRLARYLTHPATSEEALHRQQAVRELAPLTMLREQMSLLGSYDAQESKWQTFAAWLDAPFAQYPQWLRIYLLISSICLLAMSIAAAVAPAALWPQLSRPIIATALTQAVCSAFLLRWVRATLAAAAPVAHEVRLMREGLALLERQQFSSPKLAALAQRAQNASALLGQLDPAFLILTQRTKEWLFHLSLWLALGTQAALAIESWRQQHRTALLAWLDAWAEFEALLAIAAYAYENPEDCWPDITAGDATFEAQQLGHPLLPREICVRNDVNLGPASPFWVISGSNMSGKSTLLRSIGLASVLAQCGAPVRAATLRLSALRVHAAISVSDSLQEGKSRFLAEVQRLRDTLEAAIHHPVLYLIDEIFSGTNSRDRQLAADAVIATLTARRAIGAISTHDIALASIAAHGGLNVHMASSGIHPLDFDYRIKPGVTPETNAIEIARMAGVPV
ncbi:MAG: hypothetical protein JST93_16745 [Acidobacteria bacterium]|nr:hypothetical protein [Acidobacteriota bacterium]